MSLAALAAFLALVALGAYVQTLTGFALSLVVMGGVGLTGVLPLSEAAISVGVLVRRAVSLSSITEELEPRPLLRRGEMIRESVMIA